MTRPAAILCATVVCGCALISHTSSLSSQALPSATAQTATPNPATRPFRPTYASTGAIEVVPVQGRVHMLAGAGSNITVQVGDDAVFVVDTNEAAMSEKVLAAIRTLSSLPIRYIVNTSGDPDHVGGNEILAKSSGTSVNALLGQGARVYASEHAYTRLANPADGSPRAPVAMWPTDAFLSPKKTLFVTGEPIELLHQPAAHTNGDLMVFFRKSDVVATGDVFVTNGYPVIDAARGGTLQGVIDALNRLVDIAVPEYNAMGGTRIIPGHGRICNEIDVVEYRDMLTIIRDRVALMVAEGRTFAQVQAAGVSLDYDGVYGAVSGPWTTDMFLRAAYDELSATAKGRVSRAGGASRPGASPAPKPAAPAAAAARPPAARRSAGDSFDGRWTLLTAQSEYTPANTMPYRREMTLEVAGDDLTHTTSTWRRSGGNDSPLIRVTYRARFDGREYPVAASSARVVLRRIDGGTIERTAKGDRDATEKATWTLSADRRQLTVVTTGVDSGGNAYSSRQVYERLAAN
jgi:cyclase